MKEKTRRELIENEFLHIFISSAGKLISIFKTRIKFQTKNFFFHLCLVILILFSLFYISIAIIYATAWKKSVGLEKKGKSKKKPWKFHATSKTMNKIDTSSGFFERSMI